MKKDLLVFGLLLAVSLGFGWTINHFRKDPFSQTQFSEKASVPTVTLAEFRKFVENKSAIILDARGGDPWRMAHVPGALSLSYNAFEKDYANLKNLQEANKDRRIIVYCWGKTCEDSTIVAKALVKLGYQNVFIFKRGWYEWRGEGLPQESGE